MGLIKQVAKCSLLQWLKQWHPSTTQRKKRYFYVLICELEPVNVILFSDVIKLRMYTSSWFTVIELGRP
jgi:hypothetical protein